MTGWIERVGALFGGRSDAARDAAVRAQLPVGRAPRPTAQLPARAGQATLADTAPQAPTAPAAEPEEDWRLACFRWITEQRVASDAPLSDEERRLLKRLDALVLDRSAHANLLPRASSVIPQLMGSLRDQSLSSDALARQITKDTHLVAEAIRVANSAGSRGIEPVSDVPEAIRRLGRIGLQRVIARVLLKPIFDAHSGALSAKAAPRIWAHCEAQAEIGGTLAPRIGLDAFDGYLAGLVHGAGWSAALRAIDRGDEKVGERCRAGFSGEFVLELEARRERLFAVLARDWALSASISALAEELLEDNATTPHSPLRSALAEADRAATARVCAG